MNEKNNKFIKALKYTTISWFVFWILSMLIMKQCLGQETQTINLRQGYNMINFTVIPDKSISELFENTPVQLVFSLDGVYWPEGNINTYEDSINITMAYKIKTFDSCQIIVAGQPILTPKTITINAGLTYLPIYIDIDIEELFQENLEYVLMIVSMNITDFWFADFGEWNILTELKKGTGYIVFSEKQFDITFQ